MGNWILWIGQLSRLKLLDIVGIFYWNFSSKGFLNCGGWFFLLLNAVRVNKAIIA